MTPTPASPAASDAAADAALVARMAAGDQGALAALIAAHGAGVTRLAQRHLGLAAEADEVAQDTFLQAWRQAARYSPARGTVAAWLYRIAASRATDRLRRLRVRRLFGFGPAAADLADVLPDPGPGAPRVLDARQRLALVRAALAELPDRQRLALLLSAVGGLDTAAVASIMGTSAGGAEQLLVRARRALRARLPAGADKDGRDGDDG